MGPAVSVPAGLRAFVGAQTPSRPAPGGLEQVAGLLLARAAPGETDVRRGLLTRWGLDDLDPTARAACAARTRHAYTRLRRLVVSTGVPEVLRAALVLAETTAEPDLPAVLRRDGRSDGRGGLLLVEGLRRAYGGLRPSTAAWHALTEQERTPWDRLLQGLSRRGVLAVPPRLLHQTDALAGTCAAATPPCTAAGSPDR